MARDEREDLREDRRQEQVSPSGGRTGAREPFLGYDGLATDDLLEWIEESDPDPGELQAIYDYERRTGSREAVLHELGERLRRNGQRPEREGEGE